MLAYLQQAGCFKLPDLSPDPGRLCPRLAEESDQARAAFLAYLELDLSVRSLPALSGKLGKSLSLLKRWSARHKWQERSEPYDMATIEAESAARMVSRVIQEQKFHREHGGSRYRQEQERYQARLDRIAAKREAGTLHPASVPKPQRLAYVARFPQWAGELRRVEQACKEAGKRRHGRWRR